MPPVTAPADCQGVPVFAPVQVADSDCIDLEGTGTALDPINATPILTPTVDHPLFGAAVQLTNGIECTPTGLGAAPYSFVLTAGAGLPIGSLPDIVADTGGVVAWGPALTFSTFNPLTTGQYLGGQVFTTHPLVAVVLEPGASFKYGISVGCPDPIGAPFFSVITDSYVNASPSTVAFSFQPTLGVNNVTIPPAGTLDVCVVSRVELAGSTGASSVTSALFGSGIELALFGGTF